MVAATALRWLLNAPAPVVLNVNVPDVPREQLGGFERARLASYGAVQANVTESGAGYVQLEYRDVEAELEAGSDAAFLAAGIASFTPLLAVCEADGVDTSALTPA